MVHFCGTFRCVITLLLLLIIFHYYTVCVHGMGNCNMGKSVVKIRGNIGELHGDWRVVCLSVSQDYMNIVKKY